MESFFDKISNRSSPTSISHRQGLQIVIIFYRCFCQELLYRYGHVFYPWNPVPIIWYSEPQVYCQVQIYHSLVDFASSHIPPPYLFPDLQPSTP